MVADFSLLQFIDDIVVFPPNDLDMVKNLMQVLRCFKVISGLKINFNKSSLIGLSVDDFFLNNAYMVLGCKVEQLFLSHKGLKDNDWKPVIDKFQ